MTLFGFKTTLLLSAGCLLGLLLGVAPASAASSSKTKTKSTQASKTSSHKKGKHSKKSASWKRRGQQKIDPTRAREIQEALIREHYLNGEASGNWDDASQKAMEKFQADNGWQSKSVPDSRALIKLGLGPDHQHLLNPESAMTTAPAVRSAQSSDSRGSTPPQK